METRSAFDVLAGSYDEGFTGGAVGSLMRKAVWRRLETCFQPGERVLNLGCGTGEDALWLARRGIEVFGLDASEKMLDLAREKIRKAGLEDRVQFQESRIEQLPELSGVTQYDGALSNFGALNCVEDLRGVAEALAKRLRPGAVVALCLMGPIVPWEWIWYSLRGQFAKAFRRLERGGLAWRGLRVQYPAIRAVKTAFHPQFSPRRTTAVGALIPPTYAESWAVRNPRVLAFLDRWERRLESSPPLAWVADHYVLELERTHEP